MVVEKYELCRLQNKYEQYTFSYGQTMNCIDINTSSNGDVKPRVGRRQQTEYRMSRLIALP